MSKQLQYSEQARASILNGVNQLANAVKATLGPKGRNAILDKKFGLGINYIVSERVQLP